MTLYDCDYKNQVCNLYYQGKEKNCKECSIYIEEISNIQCVCGFSGKLEEWYNLDDIELISCPECGTVKHTHNKACNWRNPVDARDMIFR